jgi:hypothetical protein
MYVNKYMFMYILKFIFMFLYMYCTHRSRCFSNYSFTFHSREEEKFGFPDIKYRGIP